MRVISHFNPVALLIIFFLLPAVLPAQNKKPEKTVCSVNVPSRFSAIAYKKGGIAPGGAVVKKLSCCKGIPSRFTVRPATRQVKNS